MPSGDATVPPNLLQAISEGSGRVALIVGAGCSLQAPTSLRLSTTYATDVHEKLLLDGTLVEGDCADPTDLSEVASAVWKKRRTQVPVVDHLPKGEFRDARANEGYLVAAALLREGAVSAVLSLNFDLAMSDALGSLSANDDVSVVAHPMSVGDMGSHVVVYLHRNANEADAEKWTLRAEALDSEWKGNWQEVLSQRVLTSPVVVFAGLGSPAAVLTESIKWIRDALSADHHQTYVVDPSAATSFQAALQLAPEDHIRLGWCEFMRILGNRVAADQRLLLAGTCSDLCNGNGWMDETQFVAALCEKFFQSGLVDSGKRRSKWLLHHRHYLPDTEQLRGLIGYLLLGIGLAQRHRAADLRFRPDGVVEFRNAGRIVGSCLPVSGEGVHHWTAIEPRIRDAISRLDEHERPTAILLGSMPGTPPADVTPPEDIMFDEPADDIIVGPGSPVFVTVDDLRANPTLAERMVA